MQDKIMKRLEELRRIKAHTREQQHVLGEQIKSIDARIDELMELAKTEKPEDTCAD